MDNQKLSIKPRNGYGFIYCYTSPSGKVYIGKTKTTLKKQAQKNAKGYKGCSLFYQAIQKYGWENFEVEILAEVPLDALNETEVEYIILYKAADRNFGYNLVTDAQIYLALANCIPVYSYDADSGNFIERFNSIAEAERQMGVYYGSVRRVVNKLEHTCKGRLWRTELSDNIAPLTRHLQPACQRVYVYEAKTGNFIQEFNSIREAARTLNFNRALIQKQLRGQDEHSRTYFFRNFKVDNLFDASSTTNSEECRPEQAERKEYESTKNSLILHASASCL